MRDLFLKIPWWVYAIILILLIVLNLIWAVKGNL